MVIDADMDDLVISDAVTGTSASWLRPSLVAAGLDPDSPGTAADRDYSGGVAKKWRDVWAAGQGVGRSRSKESVADIVSDLQKEYQAATLRFKQLTTEN